MNERSQVALEVTGLAKSFGATRALRSCSLRLPAGEVHALMGENGSGKSPLVKILTGIHAPDSGGFLVGGAAVRFTAPAAAISAGVMAVYQEVLVVGPRSVLENVWLGADGVFRRRASGSQKRAKATAVLSELLERVPDLDTPVEHLSLSDRQACGIARALVREPKVLILDEATSALDVATRDRLFAAVARRKATGICVLFVSHRMDEVDAIADRVSVLRSGESVATLEAKEATTAELVRLMTGAEHLTGATADGLAHRAAPDAGAPVLLRVRGLRLVPEAEPVDFELRAGEVVGLAGLEGHGQDAFIKALWEGPPGEGSVLRTQDAAGAGAGVGVGTGTGVETEIRSEQRAAAAGIGYVPRDRRAEALFGTMSIRENFAAATLRQDGRLGLISRRSALARFAPYRARLKIRMGRESDPITSLSGGNQQKVVIARWLARDPRVLLLNDPTRGVDIGAKRDIYALLDDLTRRRGVAVVMLSTEVDEHIELMDRVLVFREGSLSATLPRAELTRQSLVAAFFGRTVAADKPARRLPPPPCQTCPSPRSFLHPTYSRGLLLERFASSGPRTPFSPGRSRGFPGSKGGALTCRKPVTRRPEKKNPQCTRPSGRHAMTQISRRSVLVAGSATAGALLLNPVTASASATARAAGGEISVAAGETLVVSRTTRLDRLTIASGGTISAPDGYSLTLTVNGVETGQLLTATGAASTQIAPGTYRGDICLTVAVATRWPSAASASLSARPCTWTPPAW
ncbi:sugar ABC transporter ATP-binding protein [Actinacidiphila oryziradicis]|uniref:sugar ABC transporter ATP-binding protein n=1 Tax=Actinacidiphila oryziradicis TaxID=2571141 RepID=UPI0023F55F72|nr:sugar ABC transporter ATP-binding protein [Actinacidiphila oryziradicis]